MTTQLSHLHSQLIINDARVDGLSDDDVPVELPDINLAEVTYGKDGTMYSAATGMRGGEVIVRLLPTSKTGKAWIRNLAEIQNGKVINFKGTYTNQNLSYATLLRGGVMTDGPSSVHPGKNSEFKFQFEECIPQYDSAKFADSPVISDA